MVQALLVANLQAFAGLILAIGQLLVKVTEKLLQEAKMREKRSDECERQRG